MIKSNFAKPSLVYLIFTASGATALIYQVIWSRWLGLLFGNTTLSVSIVLGCFMLGLAFGSWGIGRILHRINNPMRAYALMELGIGVFAFCFPLLVKFIDNVYLATVSVESTTAFSLCMRTVLAFSLLFAPTTLMGATLPLLTEFFHRSPRPTRSWKIGLLYAANTLGAGLGIIVAGFYLIEAIGVLYTTMLAAGLNLTVAGGALLISFSTGESARQAGPGVALDDKIDAMGKLAVVVLTASGAVALASEVLWTRTVETIVGNSTYAFSMIVFLFLVGIAVGSWFMSLMVNRLNRLPLWLASIQLGMGIWIIIAIVVFRMVINDVAQYKAVMMPLSVIFWNYLKVMSIVFPLSLLSGACFPLATRILDPHSDEARGTLIAKAYAWNTAGAVAGSLVAGFLIAPFFEYFNSLYLLAFLYALTAFLSSLVIFRSEWQTPRNRLMNASVTLLSLALLGTAFIKSTGQDFFVTRYNAKHTRSEIVYHKPGLQGVTTVLKDHGAPTAFGLLVNGLGMTAKVTDTKMMAHLPLLIHPDPQDTLVICFGMGTTYRSAITHGGNVTVVELVKEVLDAFDYFYEDAPRVRSYAKGRMLVNDGRNFLKLTKQQFDVITLDPPPPIDAAGVNNLYSKEFIELAKAHLKKGGIMAHWLPLPETLSGVDDIETFNMLFQTFAAEFPYVYVQLGKQGVGLHIMGSAEPLTISRDRIAKRLQNKAILNDINEWDQIPPTYFDGIRRSQSSQAPAGMVTDDRPLLEFYLVRVWENNRNKMFAYSYW